MLYYTYMQYFQCHRASLPHGPWSHWRLASTINTRDLIDLVKFSGSLHLYASIVYFCRDLAYPQSWVMEQRVMQFAFEMSSWPICLQSVLEWGVDILSRTRKSKQTINQPSCCLAKTSYKAVKLKRISFKCTCLRHFSATVEKIETKARAYNHQNH